METLILIACVIVAALFLRQPDPQHQTPLIFIGRPEDLTPQYGGIGCLPFVLVAVLIIVLVLGSQ